MVSLSEIGKGGLLGDNGAIGRGNYISSNHLQFVSENQVKDFWSGRMQAPGIGNIVTARVIGCGNIAMPTLIAYGPAQGRAVPFNRAFW